MEVIVAIVVVLAIVTIFLCGLWVVGRTVLRILLGKPVLGDPESQVRCKHCGRWTSKLHGTCGQCGRELVSPADMELEDLAAFERQLNRFAAKESLAPETVAMLLEKISERRQALGSPWSRPVPEEAAAPTTAQQRQEPPKPVEVKAEPREAIILADKVAEVAPPRRVAPPTTKATPAVAKAEPIAPAKPATPAVSPPVARPEPQRAAVPVAKPEPVRPPVVPRQPLWETIAEFLEKRNIEWAELVVVVLSGLLIVGASVALVINFWGTLRAIPWLKFAIFVVYSSGIFGVGLLCYRRWKLETIGRGLLMIATLLVPLNFLAMASLSRDSWDWMRAGLELASLGIFGWLVYLGGRALVQSGRWLLAAGVVGNSAAVLLVARMSESGAAGWTLSLVGLIPVAVFVAAMGIYLYRRPAGEMEPSAANELFTLLGTTLFSLASALGLLVQKGIQVDQLAATLDHASVLVVLTAFPILAAGLAVMRGMSGEKGSAVHRTVGTGTALASLLLMVAAVVMAWPSPLAMLLVGAVAMVTLAVVAVRYELPVAHAGAIAAAAVVYLTGYHLAVGNVALLEGATGSSMMRAVMGPQTGAALMGLIVLLGLAAETLRRIGRQQHAIYYLVGCGVVAAISLFLVTAHGLRGSATEMWIAMIAYAIYGAGALAVNVSLRKPVVSYLGSGLVGIAALWASHALAQPWANVIREPWVAGLLVHGTLGVAAVLLLRWWVEGRGTDTVAEELQRVFVKPLSETALVSSGLAAPALALLSSSQATMWVAVCLWWLAVIWLVIAWMDRQSTLLALGQVAMAVATVMTTTVWLKHHPLGAAAAVDLTDPRCWQVYGIGLALLALAWLGARLGLRRSEVATLLLEPDRPSVDWIIAHGVVVLQLLLVAVCLVPCCAAELTQLFGSKASAAVGLPLEAFGTPAWILAGLSAVWLAGRLWYRWRVTELVASLLVAATVPAIVAGAFGSQFATASATRWAMGAALMVVSVAVWQRERLLAWARMVGARIDVGPFGPRVARTTLMTTMVPPVVGITLAAALVRLAGATSAGPATGTFFAEMGMTWSYLVPLVLVVAAMVGFAVRESSAAYAFAGGLVVEMAVVLGYLLHIKTFGTAEGAAVIQLATIAAGMWAIAWLVGRRWVNVWREGDEDREPLAESGQAMLRKAGVGRISSSATLMDVQLGLGLLGNAALLMPAWLAIVGEPYAEHVWARAVGTPLGWIALAVVVAAVVLREVQLGRLISPHLAGIVGMTMLGLLACTIETMLPGAPQWGYRTLMLGLAAYSLFVVLVTWWVASLRTDAEAQGPPQALVRAASSWVAAAGLAAVALGLKAAFLHESYDDLLWAAAAIAVASLAGATMAFWRREEGWAFAAAPGVNLAASLVVWYVQWHSAKELSTEQWLILMGQANVIASMAVALVWLAARKRLYELRDLTIRTSPLLGVQTSLGVAGSVALLVPPVLSMWWEPQSVLTWRAWIAEPAGWLALLLTAAAAAWYLWQTGPEKLGHVLAGAGLGVGALAACLMERVGGATALDAWKAYHVLEGAWVLVGFVVLGVGLAGRRLRLEGHAPLQVETGSDGGGRSGIEKGIVFPAGLVRVWVAAIGVSVLVLSVPYCRLDPAGPWWSMGAILSVSVLAGVVGVWQRQPAEVLASGLLLNVAATAYWWAGGRVEFAGLAGTNMLAFASSSVVWSIVERLDRRGVPAVTLGAEEVPAAHLAAQCGLVLLTIYTAVMLIGDAASMAGVAVGRLGWSGLAALAVAVAMLLWIGGRGSRWQVCMWRHCAEP